MPSASGRPFLSEAINYDTDIEPYQFIKIYAGVGSGKNVFVDNLVKGNVFKHSDGSLVEKKYVLLFTSRRAKANEQLKQKNSGYDKAIGIYDSWDYYFDDEQICQYETSETCILPDLGGLCSREIKLRSCSCTNAQAETACSQYTPNEPITHPWERFDFIVIDEAHAILADANYQSAPFYIQRLLEEVKAGSPKCKVIVMTGSPEIVKDYPLFQDYHLIDKMDVCDNLTPNKVTFISRKYSEVLLGNFLEQNQKTVCYLNRINDITKTAKRLDKEWPGHVATSFTTTEKRSKLRRENLALFKTMEAVEDSLTQGQLIPEEIGIFLTNARNKEGINIKNTDIRTMLVQTHAEVDIRQMAGRVRNGVDNLYVVVDSPSFDDHDLPGELDFTENSNLLDTVNTYFEKLAESCNYSIREDYSIGVTSRLAEYVEFVHEKFPFIRFDYFNEEFVFYAQRQVSKAYYDDQTELFNLHTISAGFHELARMWFPNAECSVHYNIQDTYKRLVDEYIQEHNLLGKRLKKKSEQVIFTHLKELTHSDYHKLGNLLRAYGYRKKDMGKTCIGDWTIVYL